MNNIIKMTKAGIVNVSFAAVIDGVVTTDLTPSVGVSQRNPKKLDSGLAYLDC